jgi:hypothetical protein
MLNKLHTGAFGVSLNYVAYKIPRSRVTEQKALSSNPRNSNQEFELELRVVSLASAM